MIKSNLHMRVHCKNNKCLKRCFALNKPHIARTYNKVHNYKYKCNEIHVSNLDVDFSEEGDGTLDSVILINGELVQISLYN